MILSASRRTDLPAWYYEWFLERLKAGFVLVRNPFSYHQISRISLCPEQIDGIVFWSKNPEPMLRHPEPLFRFPSYLHFTLNAYGKETEPGLPPVKDRIQVFQRLSSLLGQERILWRYDPVLLSDNYTVSWHKKRFAALCASLSGFTSLCTFSFLDLYPKITRRLHSHGIRPLTSQEETELVCYFAETAARYEITAATCAELLDTEESGILKGACIDAGRLEKIGGIQLSVPQDRNQRSGCNCCESIDIGQYHTCRSGCIYCYANSSSERTLREASRYRKEAPLLCSECEEGDRIRERAIKVYRDPQFRFL